MPITFLHIPFMLLLVLMLAAPGAIALLMLALPASRDRGKKLFAGTVGATLGLIVYQLAYIPVLIFASVLTVGVDYLLKVLLGSESHDAVNALVPIQLLLLFYVFWFIALVIGLVSGFKVGWRFASGSNVQDSLRIDYLVRLALAGLNFIARLRTASNAT